MNIPTSKVVDKQSILKRDGEIQRALAINLQKKFEPKSRALWKEHQDEMYLNTLQVSNEPSLTNLIANEKESENQSDVLQSESLTKSNLPTITDDNTSDYILDRLEFYEIQVLNQRFPEFLAILKEKLKKINKDSFISLIKSETSDFFVENPTREGCQD
jgi:hypothetical protein